MEDMSRISTLGQRVGAPKYWLWVLWDPPNAVSRNNVDVLIFHASKLIIIRHDSLWTRWCWICCMHSSKHYFVLVSGFVHRRLLIMFLGFLIFWFLYLGLFQVKVQLVSKCFWWITLFFVTLDCWLDYCHEIGFDCYVLYIVFVIIIFRYVGPSEELIML
jgi:hypothetical protein